MTLSRLEGESARGATVYAGVEPGAGTTRPFLSVAMVARPTGEVIVVADCSHYDDG